LNKIEEWGEKNKGYTPEDAAEYIVGLAKK